MEQPARNDTDSPDWLSVDEHEEVLWEDSPSFRLLLLDFLLSVALVWIGAILVAVAALQPLNELSSNLRLVVVAAGGLMAVAGVLYFLFNYRSHQNERYAITTEAIYRKWTDSTTEIEMKDVCSVLCEQPSWLDRRFSCGDLKVHWSKAGREETTYPAVPNPEQVQRILLKVVGKKGVEEP